MTMNFWEMWQWHNMYPNFNDEDEYFFNGNDISIVLMFSNVKIVWGTISYLNNSIWVKDNGKRGAAFMGLYAIFLVPDLSKNSLFLYFYFYVEGDVLIMLNI